jgi:segregation and condensation protein A
MPYEIKLDVFEGPLDLLLHLIHKNEVSITDIPIALITRQYLETVELMKSLNLDIAGEYLVMAAYLTHIKSQMLLPVEECDTEDEKGQDPREELVANLLQYKRHKEAAQSLVDRPLLNRDIFVRESALDDNEVTVRDQPIKAGLPELMDALKELLRRTSRRDLIELAPDRLQVKDKINEILEHLKDRDWTTFAALFEDDWSRINIVTTFLALLDLVKLQVVGIYQDTAFGTVLIQKREKDPSNRVLEETYIGSSEPGAYG